MNETKIEKLAGGARIDGVNLIRIVGDTVYTRKTEGDADKVSLKTYRSIKRAGSVAGLVIGLILCGLVGWLITPVAALFVLPMFTWYANIKAIIPMKTRRWHGAEHRGIKAYETGKLDEAYKGAKITTIHKRCGTNLLTLAELTYFGIIAAVIASPMGLGVLGAMAIGTFAYTGSYMLSMILISFAPHPFAYPGMLAQKLFTIREPSIEQTRAVIDALNKLLVDDKVDPNQEALDALNALDGVEKPASNKQANIPSV